MVLHLPKDTLLQNGKYRIVRFINSGGFGCTYEALHTMLDQRFAIKEFFVKDFCNRDEQTAHVSVGITSKKQLVAKLRSKFIDEARGLSKLKHPGIVKVSDVFEENGTAYFVMEYIDGRSIDDIIKQQGPLTEQETLRYVLQVCDALEYVHAHNRLHLDIKPGNIMVDKDGTAILIDFGASKQYDECNGENTSTLMGRTPGYAPLEQMSDDVFQFLPATDIYALGATMYKMLTGQTPPSANILALGQPLDPLPANVSPNVANAVMWAMQSKTFERPQSIAEFRKMLTDPSWRPASKPSSDDVTVLSEKKKGEVAVPMMEGKKDVPYKGFGENKKKSNKSWPKIAILSAAGALIAFAVTFSIIKFWPENAQAQENQIEEVADQGTLVTDWDYTNSKGVKFKFTGTLHKDSIPNGSGAGIYADGTYVGEYVNGLMEGEGTYKTSDGSNTFKGTFKDDNYLKGRLEFDDGTYYEGTFVNGEYGDGYYHYPDGTKEIVKGGEVK